MNRHFEDARYYLKRAGETARKGVAEELDPVEERFRELTGTEEEPEPGRLEKIHDELEAIQAKAEREAKGAIADARGKIEAYRN